MKFYKYKIIILLFILAVSSISMAKPRVTIGSNPYRMSPDVVVLQRIVLNANNIASYFQNTGIFDQNTTSGNTAGLEWPKGSGRTASFTAGLSLGCGINGQYAQVMASYKGEYAPGHYKSDGTWETTGDFKMYSVRLGDGPLSNPDYANWYKMVPYGAPYKDMNNNHQYDDGIDIPGMSNSGMTIFECMGDGDVSQRSPGEGFGGGINTPLLGAEIHLTSWAYTTPGLEDLQFINYVILNKGLYPWDSTFMGIVVDPDLGDATDDYIGCDVNLNLGYCYNGDDNDGNGAPPTYGAAPPAFGMDYFKSPIYKDPSSPNFGDTLGMTSFVYFTNTGSSPPPCESDPNGEPIPAYTMLQGMKKDRSPFLDPTQNPPAVTKFCYPGDPETGTGWTESKGSVTNCGGITGTTLTTNPSGDRRFIFNSGALDFRMMPGDTQNIVVAQFVARGSSNKNSVTKLKSLSKTAKIIYDNNFNVTPPPPPPQVNVSYTPLVNGLCNVTLSWGDISESYNYWDTIFYSANDSNIYKFEGYEIYEINKFANQLPDFTKPYTVDPSVLRLVNAFDVRNNIGLVIDTFSTGTIVSNNEVYAPFPIVPPFNMVTPTGFPNKGLQRSITLTSTQFSSNYAGQSSFVYGQEYQFAVVAYGVSSSSHLKRGFKVIRNSIGTQIFKVRPTAPPAGTVFALKNGDTLNTNMKDLGLTPVIRNSNLLLDATYRVQFSTDSTYNLMRKLAGATKYDTVKTNLLATNFKSTTDEASRTIDGVLLNVQKIRFSGSAPNYVGNVGILKDNSSTLTPDSIQNRVKGWEWSNPVNPFLTGSKFQRDASRYWQSRSQSVSYPMAGTFTNLRSALTPDQLRKVTIQWTAPGQGQFAYYYQDTSLISDNYFVYKGMQPVPFKVFVDTLIVEDPTIPSFRVERRQVNCAFVESADSINGPRTFTNGWNPSTDTLGGKLLLYTFATSYDTTITTPYKVRNLFLQQSQFDIMFVWSPRLVSIGGKGNPGEEFYLYPYTATRKFYNGTAPLIYEFTTKKPAFGDMTSAKNEMDKIRAVPNPYYGFSTLDRSSSDKFVTFTHLPLNCAIKIYTLNGDLIKTITKTGTGDPTFNSTIEWNLQNEEKVPVASGIYVALIDAPNIGTKILKLAIFTSQERINF
ncbi:MAG: hypothetical protein WCK13_04805 [Ignavibacteriota bacterium]|nr:hypothetical protein [Ignavibacteriota bacterium]